MAPQLSHAGSRFLARGTPVPGEAAAGDHLQAEYHLWLVGHQLSNGRAPWRDPYTFRPESPPRWNFGGWPFGLVFWPLDALFGHVRAWNLFLLLTYLAAGGFAYLWLRELALPAAAAAFGGLVFALEPYRVAQSAGHLRGPISALLPLALWALERGRRGSPLVVRGRGCGARVDPVLGRAPRARGDPVLPALRALPRGLARRRARHRSGAGGRAARRPLLHQRDRLGRPLSARGGALLRDRPRLRHPAPEARARELRLPRLADAAARARGAGRAGAGETLVARRGARGRRARADAARARDALPALLDALAPLPAAALPARSRAAAAGGVPGAGGSRRVRRRTAALGAGRRAARARRGRPARLDLRGGGGRAREAGVRGPERTGAAARAAGSAPERPPRLDLPLVRPGRPARAAGRLLDDRAEVGRTALATAVRAELRRLAARRRRAPATPRRPLRRLPPRSRRRDRLVRLARAARTRLRTGGARRRRDDARARPVRRSVTRSRAEQAHRPVRRLAGGLAALPPRRLLGPRAGARPADDPRAHTRDAFPEPAPGARTACQRARLRFGSDARAGG